MTLISGDSYTSTNFDINGAQPSLPNNPMGNTDLGDHKTSANGPVWINYLTTNYNSTPVLTYNFAVGGAAILEAYAFEIDHWYQPKYTTHKFWQSSNTLFLSWVGINDCTFCWLGKGDFNTIDERLDKFSELLETLYRTGTRNLLIVNVPPLYRSPVILGIGPEGAEIYRKCVLKFNDDLPSHVETWAENHPDVRSFLLISEQADR